MNRPHFCAGWLCGYDGYGANHAQRLAPKTITATELLRYIAHYDPRTKQYSLDKEQISHLEETLGRVIGYLCAALSQESPQEQQTDSLPVVLREA